MGRLFAVIYLDYSGMNTSKHIGAESVCVISLNASESPRRLFALGNVGGSFCYFRWHKNDSGASEGHMLLLRGYQLNEVVPHGRFVGRDGFIHEVTEGVWGTTLLVLFLFHFLPKILAKLRVLP